MWENSLVYTGNQESPTAPEVFLVRNFMIVAITIKT